MNLLQTAYIRFAMQRVGMEASTMTCVDTEMLAPESGALIPYVRLSACLSAQGLAHVVTDDREGESGQRGLDR